MVGGHETGNETYVRGLVDGFSQLDREFELYVYHVDGPWRANTPNVHLRPIAGASPWIRLAIGLPRRTVSDNLDVMHTTYTAPLWTRCPVVLTVHDISYVAHPEWFSRRDLRVLSATVPLSIGKAERVITVSEVCRQQIIEHYRVPNEKVVSIPNAAGPGGIPLSDETAREQLASLGLDAKRPYILAVGNLQPRKNLVRLIEAFRNIVATGLDVDLVVAGPQHFRAEEVLRAGRDRGSRIRFPGYVTDLQLAACYSRASVFAFPSLFEGFGIPALEAMSHGTPVVCSRAGALPEVCGDAALYFDPLDVDSISDALQRALTDDSLRANLVAAGRARERAFTWRRAAEQTLDVYRQAAGQRSLRETRL
jgi:glycosyltransferase involved in cell wall biosynthesis